jgi:hypothetical protein
MEGGIQSQMDPAVVEPATPDQSRDGHTTEAPDEGRITNPESNPVETQTGAPSACEINQISFRSVLVANYEVDEVVISVSEEEDSSPPGPSRIPGKGKGRKSGTVITPHSRDPRPLLGFEGDPLNVEHEIEALIVDFHDIGSVYGSYPITYRPSVADLVFGDDDSIGPADIMGKYTRSRSPAFRWIHLPANNMLWVEVCSLLYHQLHFVPTMQRSQG